MISPEQSRAARGWLGWSQDELAKEANVSLSTIRDFEKGRRVPIANNLGAIQRVFHDRGIKFLDHNGQAVGITLLDAGVFASPLKVEAKIENTTPEADA